MSCKALVLCGGYGTRLGKLTQALPKPLLPVGDVPLVGHTLALLAHHGIDQVAINTHFLPEAVEDALEDGARFGVDLHYAHEPKLLGTAGALANLRDYFADASAILVIYGDLLTDQDLRELVDQHERHSALATLLLHRRERSNSIVAMDADGRLSAFLERPSDEARRRAGIGKDAWVNSGVQVISPELLAEIPDGVASDLPKDVYAHRVAEGRFFGVPLTGYRCAIDSPERYREAALALESGRVRSFVPCPVGNG